MLIASFGAGTMNMLMGIFLLPDADKKPECPTAGYHFFHPIFTEHVFSEFWGGLYRQGELSLVPCPRTRNLRRNFRDPDLAGNLFCL